MVDPITVPLVSRPLAHAFPLIVVSYVLGLPLAALTVAVALGIGVEPVGPAISAVLLAIAVVFTLPALWAARRTALLRRPARVRFFPDLLSIEYPERLREPLEIPRDAIRAAAVDPDPGPDLDLDVEDDLRFRVHATSGPYGGGEDDLWLWSTHGSPLPVLPPDRGRPTVALLFDRPVPAPALRRQGAGGPLRGEQLAGLLLAVRDPHTAERALDAWSLLRPLTMPDLFALEERLGHITDDPAAGTRRGLLRRQLVRSGWGLIAIGVFVPVLAGIALFPAYALWRAGERLQPTIIALLGIAVFAARLALYLG
jgi:hypothetical protein